MEHEDQDNGRVLLKEFYRSALGGNWQFTEKEDYLRETGVLDDSYHTKEPAVMIPNYVNAPSNCLASSSIYQVCCINECEALMAPIEQQVGAHEATTERVLEIVANLASSTMPAPRKLSQELKDRLQDVANHHSGTVPLHGRLFAQWLHHAYPRECPYPGEAGSTIRSTKDASRTSSPDQMRLYVDEADAANDSTDGTAAATKHAPKLPWSPAEELIARHGHKKKSDSWVRKLAFVIASISGLIAMFHTVGGSFASLLQTTKSGSSVLPYVKKQHSC